MTPMECAALMMRNNADPGLIAAYLRLELERDPTIAMSPLAALGYRIRKAFAAIGEGWVRTMPSQADFILAAGGKRR